MCQDPRDKVYAIPALAPRNFAERITISYDESKTLGQVYKEVAGVHFATISNVSEPLPDLERWESIQHIGTWEPVNLDNIYKPTGETAGTPFALILIDYNTSKFVDNPDTEALISEEEWRVLVYTHEEYIGLAQADTQKSDTITTTPGCQNPTVVRPTIQGQYTVIGVCIVHGLWYSTKLLDPLPKPWRWVERRTRRLPTIEFFNTEMHEKTPEDTRLEPLDGFEMVWEEF
ncbi:hypothetical protein CDV31_015652 [Fusarium ambrosium]|uniref:Uncharacterized protein n=1 Tax=Fusarium ambrosium TaxID=131363 RepID=A0A428SLA8_9HYPO|nr:hypothetical protein CDV31_015652 [Fusarium ambrosium]